MINVSTCNNLKHALYPLQIPPRRQEFSQAHQARERREPVRENRLGQPEQLRSGDELLDAGEQPPREIEPRLHPAPEEALAARGLPGPAALGRGPGARPAHQLGRGARLRGLLERNRVREPEETDGPRQGPRGRGRPPAGVQNRHTDRHGSGRAEKQPAIQVRLLSTTLIFL